MIKKYTLYLGLNDKDTKTQKIATLEAYKFITNLLKLKGFDGATIYEAIGLYRHESGEFTTENTLRIELLFTEKEKVLELIKDLKNLFNQESVALQEETIESELI